MLPSTIQLAVEALGGPTASALASEVATTGARAAARRLFRWRGRAERLALYNSFQRDLIRARYRLQMLMAVHSIQTDPRALVVQVTGFPIAMGMLERFTEDLAEVTHGWRRIAQNSSPAVAGAAESAILAIVARMPATDPGWYRPLKRRKHAREVEALEDAINRAVRHFELMCLADAAPSRRARRSARADASDGTASAD